MIHLEREKYLHQIEQSLKPNRVVVITGLRGCGKSTLLEATVQRLRQAKPPVRIVRVDGETEPIDEKQLLEAARALGVGPSALCIDNGELIEGLFAALIAITANYDARILLTGHRTEGLEVAARESGALDAAIVPIFPFTYAEFLAYREKPESRDSLAEYARTGGLPASLLVEPGEAESNTLRGLLADSFVLRNILERRPVRNPGHLRTLLTLIARFTGEALSAREICAAFAADRLTLSPQAALDYLELCRESGLIEPVPVLNLDTGKPLETGFAWYFADNGLRSAFEPHDARWTDRAAENLVYLALREAGWKLSQGRVSVGGGRKERIAFVAEQGAFSGNASPDNVEAGIARRVYVQVAGAQTSAAEMLRKRRALLAPRDAWQRCLVDPEGAESDPEGITRKDLRELLLRGLG